VCSGLSIRKQAALSPLASLPFRPREYQLESLSQNYGGSCSDCLYFTSTRSLSPSPLRTFCYPCARARMHRHTKIREARRNLASRLPSRIYVCNAQWPRRKALSPAWRQELCSAPDFRKGPTRHRHAHCLAQRWRPASATFNHHPQNNFSLAKRQARP